MIPRDSIIDLAMSRPAIRIAMWIDTLIDSSIFREWVVNVGRRDSRTRISHLLCELATRLKANGHGDGDAFDLPLTQEQLADATGLTAVHTNRTLQKLRREGLIHLNSGSLKILDWDKLREAGDFDELYLHQKM
jgi:CRP-like cAMP-binding protein